jgi:hypothetical protein
MADIVTLEAAPGDYVRWPSHPGVICYVDAYCKITPPDPADVLDNWIMESGEWVFVGPDEMPPRSEWEDDLNRVKLHMVGDDTSYEADTSELVVMADNEDVCSCGQDGCGWGSPR